ncbi:MAG: transposase, partial [Terriglobales bacterium]
MATLFLDTMSAYRNNAKSLLHEFVLMPDHFHLLLTPIHGLTLERAMQLIKGGFSYRVGKELA